MRSVYGTRTLFRLRRVLTTLALITRRPTAIANGAKPVAVTSSLNIQGWGLTDVYAAVIPDFPYQPGVHVNYQETVLRIKDGLPKLKDVPEELGGSGASVAE